MGQAFDEDGGALGPGITGETRREVFEKLMEMYPDSHEVRIKRLRDSVDEVEELRKATPKAEVAQQAADDFSSALVELTLALDEWKNAGADVLTVTGAIQRFVHAITACQRIAAG